MYRGVPTCENASRLSYPKYRPSPRSPSFSVPLDMMRMLLGLISRWIILFWCICSTASVHCEKYVQMTLSDRYSFAVRALVMMFFKSPFPAHSRTMYRLWFFPLSVDMKQSWWGGELGEGSWGQKEEAKGRRGGGGASAAALSSLAGAHLILDNIRMPHGPQQSYLLQALREEVLVLVLTLVGGRIRLHHTGRRELDLLQSVLDARGL